MAETHGRTPPDRTLDGFKCCVHALQAVEARLSSLIARCSEHGLAHAAHLDRLPALASFDPFAAPAAAAAGAETAGANARSQPRASAMPADPRPLRGTRQAMARTSHADRMGNEATASPPPREVAGQAAHGMSTPPPIAATAAGEDAGALITALLRRHTAPRPGPQHLPRLHPTGGTREADGRDSRSASSGLSMGPDTRPARVGHLPAAAGPVHVRPPAAVQAAPDTTPSYPRAPLRQGEGGWPGRTALHRDRPGRADVPPPGHPADNSLTGSPQLGNDALRQLVGTLFATAPRADLRPAPAQTAAGQPAGRTSGAPALLPQGRAPSRLLGAQDAVLARTPQTTGGAPTQAEHHADAAPSHPGELAAGLERLLREQAWLRGVDLS